MLNQLKQAFFQVFTLTLLWEVLLHILFKFQIQLVNAVGIALISACIFGVFYNLLWNYLLFKASWNILISSIFNTLAGFLVIFLVSHNLFLFIKPWIIIIFILTLLLHTIAFYFYARFQNQKHVRELNNYLS